MLVLRSPSPAVGTPRRGEQGVADDQPRAHALGDVVADAAVVVGETVELEVRDEPIEPDGDAGRPVEDLGRDLGGDRVGAGVGEIEDLADLSILALDRGDLGRLDTGDQVVDLEHLDVRARLGVDLREVGVHVEHPGVRVAEEADARRPKGVNGARGVEPLAQGVPGGVAVEQRPRDRPVGNRGTCQGARDLRDAACRAVREPFAGGHRLVVERARGLEVQDDDRRVDRLHDGEHLGRRRIRRRVDEEELRSAGGERVAGGAGRLGSVDEARRDDLRAHRLEPLLDPALVSLEPCCAGRRTGASTPRARCRRPRPGVGRPASRSSSSCATAACLRAPAACSRVRARR